MPDTEKRNHNRKGGFETKCFQCGKAIWVKPSRSEHPRHFCSKECSEAWGSENIRGEKHWRWQGGSVDRICDSCGQPFKQRLAEFNRNPGKFCSRKCMGEKYRSRIQKYCEVCGAMFEVRAHKTSARFCSHPCKVVSQVKKRTEKEIARKRINHGVASKIWAALRSTKTPKRRRKWEDVLGYTVRDLMAHLESLFTEGMTWGNFGKGGWHIDHKKPQCLFSYDNANDPQFKECWSLTNLQPLWEIDNLRKGSTYIA